VSVARVFISHTGVDTTAAAEVHRWLVGAGHEVFLDRDEQDGIVVGDEWEQRLHERLRWADAVVCVITSSYVASVWCAAEVGIARARGSRLFPVRAEPEVLHPLLQSVQHVDLTADLTAARAALIEGLRRVDAGGGSSWPDDRSPFPGLRAFDTDRHRVFFGRGGEAEQLAALLRSPAEHAEKAALLVVGPSGCGKSSLVRAGLLPLLADEPGWWVLPAVTPGVDPTAALTRELAAAARRLGLGWTVADTRGRLDGMGLAEVTDELLLAAPGSCRQLLVVVDQFEELFAQTTAEHRSRFAELLATAVAGPVRLVATLRPEYLDQLLADPCLAGLPTRTHALRPLRSEALGAVIEGPARLAGIEVDPDLVARLVADTGSGDALPLLAYTLAELADGVERGGRLLAGRYEQLGGVHGALVRQADAALAHATATAGGGDADVIDELLGLVTVDEHGRPARRRVRWDNLSETGSARLNAFVSRRLLTSDTEDGHVVVGVAHEAFLSSWPPLAGAIAAASTALRARRGIDQAAERWARHGRPAARLWERGQLAAELADVDGRLKPVDREGRPDPRAGGLRWWGPRRALVTGRVQLDAEGREFLTAAIRRDRRLRRGRATTVLTGLLVLALIAAGVAVFQQRAAEDRALAANAESMAREATARSSTDPVFAAKAALAAWRTRPASATTRAALARQYLELQSVDGVHPLPVQNPVGRFEISRDRSTALVYGQDEDPVIVERFLDPDPEVWPVPGVAAAGSLAFSPDGRRLAGLDRSGSLLLWDVRARSGPTVLGARVYDGSAGLTSSFTQDGGLLAAVGTSVDSGEYALTIWDVARRIPVPHAADVIPAGDSVAGVWLTPGRDAVVVESTDGVVDEIDPPVIAVSLSDGAITDTFPGGAVVVRDGEAVVTCVASTGATEERSLVALLDPTSGVETGRIPLLSHTSCDDDRSLLTLTGDRRHLVESRMGEAEGVPRRERVTDLADGSAFDLTIPAGGYGAYLSSRFGQAYQDWVVAPADGTRTPSVLMARGQVVLRADVDRLAWTGGTVEVTSTVAGGRHLVVRSPDGWMVRDVLTGARLGGALDGAFVGTVEVSSDSLDTDGMLRGEHLISSYTLPDLVLRNTIVVSDGDGASESGPAVDRTADRVIATGGDGRVSVWDARGQPLAVGLQLIHDSDDADWYTEHAYSVLRPGHPDQFLTWRPDQTFEVWSITAGGPIGSLSAVANDGYRSTGFDSSGNLLAVLNPGGTLEVWDIDRNVRVGPSLAAPDAGEIVGFTADGSVVTSNFRDDDTNIRLQFWDIATGSSTEPLPFGADLSRGLGRNLVEDGRTLTLDGTNVSPLTLPVTAGQWADALCAAFGADFTEDERALLPAGSEDARPCP